MFSMILVRVRGTAVTSISSVTTSAMPNVEAVRALLALALQERKDGRAQEVAKLIEGSAQQDEFEAHWQTARVNDYGRDVYLDAEATSLSLKALSRIKPDSFLLPRAARWLVQNRRNGYYWLSTKETAFAIYGLTDYLKVSKELSPDYTFEVYLNGIKVAGQHVGASDATNAETVTVWKKGGEIGPSNQIRIVKHGKGALYVSSALEYFTADENVAAQSAGGLKIAREYLRLRVSEDENGKASWKVEALTGELRSGDMIVVWLRLNGPRAQYLMIEDPIPAGAEQVARGVDAIDAEVPEHAAAGLGAALGGRHVHAAVASAQSWSRSPPRPSGSSIV